MSTVTFGIRGNVIFDMEMEGAPLPPGVHAPNRLDATFAITCTEEEAQAMEAWLRARQEKAEFKTSADLIQRVLRESRARATVNTYLAGQFPGATISDAFTFDLSTHWWRVTTPSHDVLLHVSIEFLRDYSAAQIAEAFDAWGVADALKAAAPARFVLVTRDGLRENPWPSEPR